MPLSLAHFIMVLVMVSICGLLLLLLRNIAITSRRTSLSFSLSAIMACVGVDHIHHQLRALARANDFEAYYDAYQKIRIVIK